MKIDIKDGMDSKRGQWVCCTDNPYNPQKESFRWVSVSDLMSLKNILENYKYHTLKEIEDIINDSVNVFEITNRSNILLEIEDGLNMIEECLHPEDSIADVIKKSDIKPETIFAGADLKPYTFTINLNSEDTEEDEKEEEKKEEESNKESLLNALKDIIDALCNKDSNDEDEDTYTWYLNEDLWKRANARNARNLWTDPDKKETVKKILVKDRVKDDGILKSISIEKKSDGTYEVWLIRAENEPDAIKKLKTCKTMDEALDFVDKHYIGDITNVHDIH